MLNGPSGLFKPELFYELAQKLLEDSNYETNSRIRTAVSRAYYAAFLTARSRLEVLNFNLHRQQVHKEVHEAIKSKDPKLAQKLSTLRRYRNEADYDLNLTLTIHAAKSYLEICRIILKPLSELSFTIQEANCIQQKFELQLRK